MKVNRFKVAKKAMPQKRELVNKMKLPRTGQESALRKRLVDPKPATDKVLPVMPTLNKVLPKQMKKVVPGETMRGYTRYA